MNGSTRSLSRSLVVVTLLGIILVLLPLRAQGFAQSEEDHRAWLRALDSLSTERMLADVTTLSGPAFNGRQAGSKDDLGSAYWVADQFLASKISLAFVPLDRLNVPPGGRGDVPTGFMSKRYQTVPSLPQNRPYKSLGPGLRTISASERIFSRCSIHHLRMPVLRSCSSATGLSIPPRT